MNDIESVNSALRKLRRGKGFFPSKSVILKVLYLRVENDTIRRYKKGI